MELNSQYELQADLRDNTVYVEKCFGGDDKLGEMRTFAYEESIDVNLRAYLSMLYVNRAAKIFLKVYSGGVGKDDIAYETTVKKSQVSTDRRQSSFFIRVHEYMSAHTTKSSRDQSLHQVK